MIAFDESHEPDAIRYVSLFQAREHLSVLSRVAGVLSWQGDPFVYVIEAEGLQDDDLRRLRRALA
ncbi:MAG: hypothetical protein IPO67_23450, partial [Deltaproteobacteria bacterium]|nr:hypothetical protein [Deltaproteobacteria bacterium]